MIDRAHLGAHVLAAWNEALSRLVAAETASEIGTAMGHALEVILDFDAIFIATLNRHAPPECLFSSGPSEPPALRYQDGPYLLDPFYNHFLKGGTDGGYRLHDLAPDGFLRSEYFSTYYRHLDIGDEIGLLVGTSPHSCAHVAVTRKRGCMRFAPRDCQWLNATAPVVRDAIRRIKPASVSPPNDTAAFHDSLKRAFRSFGSSVLSAREQQVAHLLLRGNCAKAVARLLEITPDTARNHTKHIYRKLAVTSQAELLALFFRALEQVEPGYEGDPLTRVAGAT
jgi:DNA-binding CsgD family transcriptional regulator